MHGRNSYEDELARRRALRQRQSTAPAQNEAQTQAQAVPQAGAGADDEAPPQFDWRDIIAMIVAAYQILFPILAIMIGSMLVAYLVFRFVFS